MSRQEEIIQSIADIGTTTIDFWGNWVVHPIRNLIGTSDWMNNPITPEIDSGCTDIGNRLDDFLLSAGQKSSEIAIMSKNSLLADRESLERMVVDFVRDRPDLHQGAVWRWYPPPHPGEDPGDRGQSPLPFSLGFPDQPVS
jgi:nuclear-control-of-ATPase protein 2